MIQNLDGVIRGLELIDNIDGFVVGFTCGSFDLYHAGHALMFKDAAKHCDMLVVGLHSDPTIDRPDSKNKPIQSVEERLHILQSVRYIDYIIIYDTEAELYEILKTLKPDVRIIGADWVGKNFTGRDLPIDIVFNDRDHGYSTTDIRNRVYDAEYLKRNG
jgi:glycerol-3-phosphate cytidylyltransferase